MLRVAKLPFGFGNSSGGAADEELGVGLSWKRANCFLGVLPFLEAGVLVVEGCFVAFLLGRNAGLPVSTSGAAGGGDFSSSELKESKRGEVWVVDVVWDEPLECEGEDVGLIWGVGCRGAEVTIMAVVDGAEDTVAPVAAVEVMGIVLELTEVSGVYTLGRGRMGGGGEEVTWIVGGGTWASEVTISEMMSVACAAARSASNEVVVSASALATTSLAEASRAAWKSKNCSQRAGLAATTSVGVGTDEVDDWLTIAEREMFLRRTGRCIREEIS